MFVINKTYGCNIIKKYVCLYMCMCLCVNVYMQLYKVVTIINYVTFDFSHQIWLNDKVH